MPPGIQAVQDNQDNENIIVRQARDGDSDAFAVLYMRYVDAIYRYIYYRVGHKSEAEDLTEEVFVKAWEALPNYRITRFPFKSWLYRIAHNQVVDYHRKRRPISMADPDLGDRPNPEPNAEQQMQNQEQSERLVEAIQQLKGEEQQVILLRFVEGLSHQEVARIIGKSEAASRIIQHRALGRLNHLLGGYR